MKKILSILLISGVLFSCSNRGKRYHIDETTSPNDTLTFLKSDMSLITGIVYSKHGEIGRFIDGKRDGICNKFDNNGQLIKKGNYINGKEEGFINEYDKNGQLIEKEFYKNGKKDSTSYSYYGNGQLRQEVFFIDNKIERLFKSYHENGQVRMKINYVNGKKEGVYKSYHENGQLEEEGNYIDDKLDGIYKKYYKNGQLKVESNHKNGKIDGPYKWYNSYGNLYESFYRNGEREFNRSKLRKLYNIVTSDDLYTKSFEDFISDYGKSRHAKIYSHLNMKFESYEEFFNTFW